jgi:hypothetical protein
MYTIIEAAAAAQVVSTITDFVNAIFAGEIPGYPLKSQNIVKHLSTTT